MKISVLLLGIVFAVSVCKADAVKARGAAARKHYSESNQIDIDDVIRAEEDPGFLQYLKDREHQKKLDEAAALKYKKQRQAEAATEEKARIQFIIDENKKPAIDETRQEEQYLKEQKNP